ncbi:MAG: N-acetyltransferase [Tannerellaceae bacterium]|nr:N-acetyltransferase [Tannerellaceae bacterium]
MDITHTSKKSRGVFSLSEEGRVVGIMTYQCMDEECFIIDHTEVDDEYNGKGYGTALILYAIDYARENQKKIIPLCPFVKSYFKKHPQVLDVAYV